MSSSSSSLGCGRSGQGVERVKKKKVSDEEEKCVRTVKRRKIRTNGDMDGLHINPVTFTLQCCVVCCDSNLESFACKLEWGAAMSWESKIGGL